MQRGVFARRPPSTLAHQMQCSREMARRFVRFLSIPRNHMKNRVVFAGLTALFLSLGVGGCSDTVDEISNKIDCHTVCKRYADCFNSAYDVDGCEDKCEHSADSSEARESKLEACDDCI